MDGLANDLVAKLRAQACAVYLAAPKEVADDIAATMRRAADEISELSEIIAQMQGAMDVLHGEVIAYKQEVGSTESK